MDEENVQNFDLENQSLMVINNQTEKSVFG